MSKAKPKDQKSQSADKSGNNENDKSPAPKVTIPRTGQKFAGPGVQKNG